MFSKFIRKSRVYLDYAAATPVSSTVKTAMEPFFSNKFGNPSAIHEEGVQARQAIEAARLKTARVLGIRPEGVTWTASGTEANNLAIYGYVRQVTEEKCLELSDIEIISTAIEHPSILEVLFDLQSKGVRVHFAPLDEEGRIDKKTFPTLLSKKTVLVTFAYANSEIGTVEDVRKISRLVAEFNTVNQTNIKIHLDAAQAPLWLSCQLEKLGVDLLSLDAGKCYGPKGVGVLARKHGVNLKGVVLGGGQESGLRSGTENTPLIVGAAVAIEEAQADYEDRATKVAKLRDYFFTELEKEIEGMVVNGSLEHRLANNVNISIPKIDGEYAVVALDVAGIACSTRSACGSSKVKTDDSSKSGDLLKTAGSHVVRTITGDQGRATSTIRFSLGIETTRKDINSSVTALKKHLSLVR